MLVVAEVAALIAAAFHVFVFVLESLRWTQPSTRRTFGIASEEEARVTRPLALNQGYYNLFLGVAAAVGVLLLMIGALAAGAGTLITSCGVMLGAGIVLAVSRPAMLRAAVLQGFPPLVAIAALAVGLPR